MTLIKSIGSWLLRKATKYTLAMLDFFAYNKYYTWGSIIVGIISLFNVGPIWSIIWNFIILTWILGWTHEIADLQEENEQLKTVLRELTSDENNFISYDTFIDQVAAALHYVWAEDIKSLSNPTEDELARANTPYYDLSDKDKDHNRRKADKLIEDLHLIVVEVDD